MKVETEKLNKGFSVAHSETKHLAETQRKQNLHDRRKQEGWKRLTVWLTAQEADALQTLGDEWLACTVKALLADAAGHQLSGPGPGVVADTTRDPGKQLLERKLTAAALAERGRTIALLFRIGISRADIAALLHLDQSDVARVLSPVPDAFIVTADSVVADNFNAQSDLMQEVDTLLAQGLSGAEIARRFNAEGRQTETGAAYSSASLIRQWRRWKRGVV
jgi:hypothetical protein